MYLYVSMDTHFCKNLKPMSLVIWDDFCCAHSPLAATAGTSAGDLCVFNIKTKVPVELETFLGGVIYGKLGNYLVTIRVSNPGQGFFLGGGGIRYTRWWFEIVSMFTPNIGEI